MREMHSYAVGSLLILFFLPFFFSVLAPGEKAPGNEAQAQSVEIARLKAERKRREELEDKKNLLLKRKRELTKSRDDDIAFEDSLKVQV